MLKRLNGASVSVSDFSTRLIRYLDSLPKDVVVTTLELADTLQIPAGRIQKKIFTTKDFVQRSIRIGALRYWGSTSTIRREKDAQKS